MSDGARFVRPSLEQIPPGDPIPGLAPGVASLGLNEGLSGPFPSALAAIAAATPRPEPLSRARLRGARGGARRPARRRPRRRSSSRREQTPLIGYVCQAVLDPGDEVVIVPWPSFPSFVRDAQKRDAVPGTASRSTRRAASTSPRASGRHARARACSSSRRRTTRPGRAIPARRADRARARAAGARPAGDRRGVLRLPRAGRPLRRDRRSRPARVDDVLALRTFSKLYGLAGLRVGYGVGPAAVVAAIRKVQRGYDVGALAQVAALASLDDDGRGRAAAGRQPDGRRGAHRAAPRRAVSSRSPDSATNFVLVDVGADADAAAAALLARGRQRAVRDAVRGADLAADRCRLGGRSRAARRGARLARVRRHGSARVNRQ